MIGLLLCIKSIALVQVLIFGGVQFIIVRKLVLFRTLSSIKGRILCRNCFRLKAVNFVCKKLQLRCLTSSIRRVQITLSNIYTRMLAFTFLREDVID